MAEIILRERVDRVMWSYLTVLAFTVHAKVHAERRQAETATNPSFVSAATLAGDELGG